MISQETRDKYKLTVGIECHVQLKTKTKLFSGAGNDAREAPANTLVNHIDFGLPGALPVLNREVLKLATQAAFALNSRPQSFSKFDRKHYFYPDLPMGYQITQFEEPIILGGEVKIEIDGRTKAIGITRAHLEADAGKSVHPSGKDYSLVDLNRAGTPLLEIVSEPDMTSSQEAKAYVRELYLRMRYAGVSDANLYYGNMRFDVNVSVSQTDELGTRTETKNLNSFRSVEKCIEYEFERQIELLEKGTAIAQETRGWDEAKQRTLLQRTKEDADDYRYMPDPDLPPIILDEEYIKTIEEAMPAMPEAWRKRLSSLGLSSSQVETLIEAEVDNEQVAYLSIVEDLIDQPDIAKQVVNWMVNIEIPMRRTSQPTLILNLMQKKNLYLAVHGLVKANKLSSTNAKALIEDLLQKDSSAMSTKAGGTLGTLSVSIEKHAEAKDFIQVSDTAEVTAIVDQVIADNPKAAEDVRGGEMKAIGFLVGQVMKLSKGKANPSLAQELIKQRL
jgi:aspartyl-tRNA(Asn)/glutamyl-tRNA(Gln) amidotransferase subunit B